MGFWSALGKVLGIAGPLAAAPFTGGASLLGELGAAAPTAAAIGAGIGAAGNLMGKSGQGQNNGATPSPIANVGQVASGQAGALAQQQEAQDRQRTVRDQIALQNAKFAQDNPLARTKQAAYGDVLQNVQDSHVDFQPLSGALPQSSGTGGLRPSLFGPNARQAGGELSRQALMALMTKSDVPKMSEPQPAGALQNTLGAVGIGSSLLGALGPALTRAGQGQQPSGLVQGPGADGLPPLDSTALDPNSPMPTMQAPLGAMDPDLQKLMTPEEWAQLQRNA